MWNSLWLCSLLMLTVAKQPHAPQLLVINQVDHTMSVIDPPSRRIVSTLSETAVTGHEVATTPDGRLAFLPIYGDSGVGRPGSDGSTLEVVDLVTRRLVHTVDFGHGVRPHCAVYDRRRNVLYVTTELDQAVTILDPKTFEILGRIPTGQAQSHMLALSHDGRFGYTANVGPGTVSVLDLEARKTIAVIPFPPTPSASRSPVTTDLPTRPTRASHSWRWSIPSRRKSPPGFRCRPLRTAPRQRPTDAGCWRRCARWGRWRSLTQRRIPTCAA